MELLVTQPDDALTTSREVREQHAGRIEVLDKVRALQMLPGDTYVTTEMVAAYYEVGIEAIKTLTKDNRAELESDGYDVIEGAQLRSFKDLSGIGGRARSLALYPRRAVLRLGMLLRDSAVARQIRDYLLDAEAAALPDFNTTDGQIEMLQRMLAVAQRNKVLELQNTQQAKELESARPQSAYVKKFVKATDDVTTIKEYAHQVGMSENELRAYLVANKVIYKRGMWRTTSKGNKERVWQWVAHTRYHLWFTAKDEPQAPRLHNGQFKQTLYVNAVGKQRIAEMLQSKPPGLFEVEASR